MPGREARTYARLRLDQIRATGGARRAVDQEEIRELAVSISACGLLSPLVVRRTEAGYELVAGHRRLDALRLLGASRADALVLEADSEKAAICALVENVQRENLDCFEEAEAYRAILQATGMTQEELARRVGKSPSALANKLRLLRLDDEARGILIHSGLGERHARALLKLKTPELQKKAAEMAALGRMNVRQTEELAEKWAAPKAKPRLICRDHRLFVNALMRTVREIECAGFGVKSRVEETREGVTVTVILPRETKLFHSGDCQTAQNVIQLA